jgi:hypothetical protein
LRAFTPHDQKAVRAAAQTFRQNSTLDVEATITTLQVGEALVSVLDDRGTPTVVERALIVPPQSQIGILSEAERKEAISRSPLNGIYEQQIDRDSAFERLAARRTSMKAEADGVREQQQPSGVRDLIFGTSRRQGAVEALTKSAVRTVGNGIGRAILRGILGSIFGGKGRAAR